MSQKILVVRNDKLGDFVLALPSFALLKAAFPDATIVALVPKYTSDIAKHSAAIDEIIIDPGSSSGIEGYFSLLSEIKRRRFDFSICLFATARVNSLLFLAGIPYRLGPATKMAQIFLNHRLCQRRSQSLKPEYVYNLDLINFFLSNQHKSYSTDASAPYISLSDEQIESGRKKLSELRHDIFSRKIVVVHPGHGGSANNLSIEQYASFVSKLDLGEQYFVVVTAGPTELATADRLTNLLNQLSVDALTFNSTGGLLGFVEVVNTADIFVSGSTGPLHVAGALNRNTVAFYPRTPHMSALRWQTLNDESKRLAFSPPESANETDMQSIDLQQAAEIVKRIFIA